MSGPDSFRRNWSPSADSAVPANVALQLTAPEASGGAPGELVSRAGARRLDEWSAAAELGR